MPRKLPSTTTMIIITIVVGSILILAGFSLPFVIVSADDSSNRLFVPLLVSMYHLLP
jgi:hypothetical protein